MSAEDVQLVRRCLAGEAPALRAFVERFQHGVFGLCLRMLGHRHDAEDVSQEVFLRAFRSLKSWDSERPLEPWVLTIAANRCRTLLSTRARKVQPLPEAELPCQPEKSGADLGEELGKALATLREEYRLCFELYHVQELPLAEISRIVESPEGTIKTWLFRARRELADVLRQRGLSPLPHDGADESGSSRHDL